MPLLPYLERVAERHNLSSEEAQDAMGVILAGRASQPPLAAFLMAMRMKGETAEELVGFARAMRSMASPIEHGLRGAAILDTCGTGGDGAGTFNISTIAAFVVAGAGVHVPKHGNRSISSRSGSADLLESFGIRIDLPPADSARAIREVGIGFLFAPPVHPLSAAVLRGGDPARNFEIAQAIFGGERGPRRDIVLVNSAAGLVAAGKVDTFLEGMAIATVSIDTGAARGKLDELARFTQSCDANLNAEARRGGGKA